MSPSVHDVIEAVAAHETDMVEFARELIAIPTENPPGHEYASCAETIASKLDVIGLAPRVIETSGNPAVHCVTASYGEGKRALYFHGHYDVVPRSVEGQFEGAIRGANLFGRGSSDMKGGLAAMIYAVVALKELGVKLDGRIELMIVPDEETGGERGSAWLAREGLLGKDGVGMLTAEPTSGVVWNANRGAITLRITVKGKPAHVGLSCNGVNAFEGMLRIARELEHLQREAGERETAYRIRPDAARRSILMMGGECRGGSNFNVVPETCSFTVDRRINPEEDLETERARLYDVFDRMRRAGVAHEVELLQEGRASGVAEEHPLCRTLATAIRSVTGITPSFEMCPGLLESRFYAEAGVAALAYGPGLLSVSHGPNEFVPLRNLRDCAAIYALAAVEALA